MKRGFTLIELLVVVLIIGILSAVALPQYQKAVLKARLVELDTIADAYKKGVTAYYLANGELPTMSFTGTEGEGILDIEIPGSVKDGNVSCNDKMGWQVSNNSTTGCMMRIGPSFKKNGSTCSGNKNGQTWAVTLKIDPVSGTIVSLSGQSLFQTSVIPGNLSKSERKVVCQWFNDLTSVVAPMCVGV